MQGAPAPTLSSVAKAPVQPSLRMQLMARVCQALWAAIAFSGWGAAP